MKGMASPEQMAELAAASGTDFDRLFLQLMIKHHEGALKMVEEFLEPPGSAFDPVLFEFTTDVTNDQNAEIEKMNALLVTLSSDPRAGLAAGFADAGEAILNLERVASLPKPAGLFRSGEPGRTCRPSRRGLARKRGRGCDETRRRERRKEKEEETGRGGNRDARSPLLSFANTDMAFHGRHPGGRQLSRLQRLSPGRRGAPQFLSRSSARVGRATSRSSATS